MSTPAIPPEAPDPGDSRFDYFAWCGWHHGGHLWMMLLCIPLAALCVAGFATGFFDFGVRFAALGCVLMMALMMVPMALMAGGHRDHTHGR